MSTPAPWVRTRLRTAPLAALLTAALALVMVFLAAALPRALDRGADDALHSFVGSQSPLTTSVRATSGSPSVGEPGKELDTIAAELTGAVGAVIPLDPSGPVYGRRGSKTRELRDPGLSRPEGLPPELALLYLHGAQDHLRLTAGQWPTGGAVAGPIPVALAANAAETIGIKLGSVLDGSALGLGPERVQVAGLYTVGDPSDRFWAGEGCALKACRNLRDMGPWEPPLAYWYTIALTGPETLPRVTGWSNGREDFWRLPVQVDKLRADRLRQTSFDLAAVTAGPIAARLTALTGRPDLRISSGIRPLIDTARQRQSAIDSLTAVGPAGAAGVAAVVLCLAAALTAERRTAELRLLRARGAGTGGICRRLLGEGALTVLPAAALGALLAFTLLPTPRWLTAAVAAGSVTLLALLAFPVRTALLLRERVGGGRPGRRRLMAELLVLAATVTAATQVARRGVAPFDEGVDPLLVAAPLLLALTGALLLARLQPALIGLLARWARPRPGAVAFLGLARAARGSGRRSRPSVLPLLALVLAVTCGAVGATVLSSVAANRASVARYAIGGDAVVGAQLNGSLPEGFVTAAGRLPGVETALPVWTEEDVNLSTGSGGSVRVNVVLADPVRYARLADVAGRGRFDPALLTAVPGRPLPALVSSDLPEGEFSLRLAGGDAVPIRTVGTVDGTPALSGTAATTVLLPVGPAAELLPRLGGPDRWLAAGHPDDARLRALAEEFLGPPAAGERPGHLVRTSAGAVAELGSDPLQNSAERLFWVTVGATALFALLSVLLTLFRAGPERAAMLARLRTMGLRPRQGLALILAEALPQALFAALGGALTAVGCVLLLGPAVDLSPLVGAEVSSGLRLTAAPIAEQALGLALLAALAVVAEAAVTARRQITTELRAGDTR
ncbi:FtsX-like permease family protein [Kitasatospora sp. CMC57]|uniref:FtsX-like permease family protein n=1 Tax=Kitasatospora sp. CMC57 TaxID=3231513 RepID=A0AB33JS51_9ACTN